MMLIALALLSSAAKWPSFHVPYSFGSKPGWRVAVVTDRFDGSVSCRIDRRSARYVPGAVILQMSPSIDTSQAEYRIDEGAPHAAIHTLEALGVPKRGGLHVAVFNPSAGQVWVAEAEVMQARRVEVRANPRYPVAYFRVEGLAAALGQAASTGCGTPSAVKSLATP